VLYFCECCSKAKIAVSQGGLRAVVWTDALQTVVMMAAIIIVMVLGAEKLGGWSRVWEINETGDRLQFFK